MIKAERLNLKYSETKMSNAPKAFKKLYIKEFDLIFSACKLKYIANIKNTPIFPKKSKKS